MLERLLFEFLVFKGWIQSAATEFSSSVVLASNLVGMSTKARTLWYVQLRSDMFLTVRPFLMGGVYFPPRKYGNIWIYSIMWQSCTAHSNTSY